MMAEMVIHTVTSATWTRYGKYRVDLRIVGEPSRVCWLTPTQYDFLESAFEHTRNGYSGRGVDVIGAFDDKTGRYLRCKAIRQPPKRRHSTPLVEAGAEETVDDGLRDHD